MMNRIARTVLVVLTLAVTGGTDRKSARLNREANSAYAENRYEEAADLYQEAQGRDPDTPEIDYNLGNTRYRQGQFEEAVANLRRAAETGEPAVRHKSYYNLGNALHRAGNLQAALGAYRKALELEPSDRDAKINYEMTLRELQNHQNQQQQQQQQDQQENQQNEQQNQDQSGDSGSQSQSGQDEPQDESQDEPGDADSQGQDDPSQVQEPGSSEAQEPQDASRMAAADTTALAAGEMRPEEALRILEAMREQEKELQKERARKARARARRVDKDW